MTSTYGQVLQCGAGDVIYGVSQPGTRMAPFPGLDDGFAAISGENIFIYGGPDKDIMLQVGGTVAVGDRLKADTNGKGITTTTTGDWVGAIAQAPGTVDQLIPVQLFIESAQY